MFLKLLSIRANYRLHAFLLCSVVFFFVQYSITQAITISPVRTELVANPGQVLSAKFQLINEEQGTKTLFLTTQNFIATDELGTPGFSPKREDLALWIQLPTSVTLGPKEQKTFLYDIVIPASAEPGGYYASIVASNTPPAEKPDGSIAIGSQLGSLVLLRVNGPISEKTSILEFGTKGNKSFFRSLPVDFLFRFQNSGQSWVKPFGDIEIKNSFSQTSKIIPSNPDGNNVLSKSIRRFEASWLTSSGDITQDPHTERPPTPPSGFWNNVRYEWQNFALGRYTATLSLTYNNDTSTTVNASASFWVLPWHVLTIAIPSIILALILLRLSIKRYNRYIIRSAQKKR